MTSKKEALVKQLAMLATRHSPSDWLYAAESLEEIARLARTLAEVPKKSAARGRQKRAVADKVRINAVEEPRFSSGTQAFVNYLMSNLGTPHGPSLRDLANHLGMKVDLPKNSSAIIEVMGRHLEGLSEEDRLNKIERAIFFVEQRLPNGSSHYDRWVSLITRK